MSVQKITLSRGNINCVIQGMEHIASAHFLKRCADDLDYFHLQNYQIILEGVREREETPPFKDEIRSRIVYFLDQLLLLYPEYAKDNNLDLQATSTNYRDIAIIADFTFSELVNRLATRGFRASEILLFLIENRKISLKYHKAPSLRIRIIVKVFIWFTFRKFFPVILHERNSLVVDAIEKCCALNKKSVYVQYGDAHLKGIVKKLKRKGWKEKNREIIPC